MNEFEWLRQTRDLARPQAPDRDLWPTIATHLAPRGARRRRRWLPLAMAAATVGAAVLVGGLALHQRATPQADDTSALRARVAADRWQPRDPRLSGAAIELDAARSELAQAARQTPDAALLKRLLERTERQQDRLQRFEHQAG